MSDRIPYEDYVAIEAVNWSTLKGMRQSPLHYIYGIRNPRKDTRSLYTGRIGHAAVFEPERFGSSYIVEPDFGDCRKTDYTTKEQAKVNKTKREAWRKEHAGMTLVTAEVWARAAGMRDAVRSHPEAAPYLEAGLAEETITWTDAVTGIACKGRLDFISTSKPAIIDLKTTADILLEKFSRSALRYGYHTQEAFYRDGYMVARGVELPTVIIAVESSPPYDVGVFPIDEDSMQLGCEEYAALLKSLQWCRSTNEWPGQYPKPMPLRMPSWAFADYDLTELGLED